MSKIDKESSGAQKYIIGKSDSVLNALFVTLIVAVKSRSWLRRAIGFSGLLFIGFNIGYFSSSGLFYAIAQLHTFLLFLGIAFLLVYALSGANFEFTLEKKSFYTASKERAEAELRFEKDTSSTYAFLEVETKRLNEYYFINLNQARNSFQGVVIAMSVGLITIVFGVWFFYLGAISPEAKNTLIASLTTISEVISNVIGCMFLNLHAKCRKQSIQYYNQLNENQHIGLAIRMAESLPEGNERIFIKWKL